MTVQPQSKKEVREELNGAGLTSLTSVEEVDHNIHEMAPAYQGIRGMECSTLADQRSILGKADSFVRTHNHVDQQVLRGHEAYRVHRSSSWLPALLHFGAAHGTRLSHGAARGSSSLETACCSKVVMRRRKNDKGQYMCPLKQIPPTCPKATTEKGRQEYSPRYQSLVGQHARCRIQ